MKRLFLPALLIGAGLTLGGAQAPPQPTLCRVEATYTPATWPSWAPLDKRFRRIVVKLRPGCLRNGEAHVVLYNETSGRRLPESGYYTLTPERPTVAIPGRPPYSVTTPGWVVYWRAASGKLYAVPQTLFLPPRGGDDS